MGLSNGSCVKTCASEDVLKARMISLFTAFALAFVDGGDGRTSGFWAALPSCSLLCVLSMATYPQRDLCRYAYTVHDGKSSHNRSDPLSSQLSTNVQMPLKTSTACRSTNFFRL